MSWSIRSSTPGRYGARYIGRSLVKDRAGSALLSLLLIGILVFEFGSLGMLALERGAPDANIVTASDALWYVIATMSTVGYGDVYPVTNHGRELGGVIIVIGVGIFGAFTGFLANFFLSPSKETSAEEPAAEETPAVDDARRRLDHLKDLVAQQQAAIAELEPIVSGD